MPLVAHSKVENSKEILIWRMDEMLDELEPMVELSPFSKKRIKSFKSYKRKVEFFTARILISLAGYKDEDLTYNEAGAPVLKDSFISISHSDSYLGIIISKTEEVGIDLERQRNQLYRIRKRFIGEKEEELFDIESLDVITIIWACKEAMFKMCYREGIDFRENLFIEKIDFSNNTIEGKFKYDDQERKMKANFHIFENHALVYTSYF